MSIYKLIIFVNVSTDARHATKIMVYTRITSLQIVDKIIMKSLMKPDYRNCYFRLYFIKL